MKDGYLLTAASIRQLQADHRALRAAITRLERQLPPSTNNAPDWGRELWWGKLTKRDGDTYPVPPANTYTVRLASRAYDPTTPGQQTATEAVSDPGQLVTAQTLHKGHLPEDLYVLLLRTGSTDGERWWILPPQTPLRRAIAQEAIASDGYGEVQIQDGLGDDELADAYNDWGETQPAVANNDEVLVWWDVSGSKWRIVPSGGTSTSTSVPTCVLFNGNAYNGDSSNKNRLKYYGAGDSNNRLCHLHFINGWGDLAGVGVDVMATASSVGAGTHAYTDASFKLTQGGLYRFLVHFQAEDTTTQPAYTNDTLTTSGASAGTAHTHTVDVRREHGYRSQTRVELQWRNAGGGAWQTTADQMAGNGSRMDYSTDSGTGDTPDENTFEMTFWQNHNQVDREYRIRVTLHGSFDSATTFVQHDIYADSALIAITRLADYAADQTLTP